MLTFRVVTALDEAVARAQHHLLSRQAADGHWVGELEADRALTARPSCCTASSIASTAASSGAR